jgi:hypothetical protein
VTPLMVLQGFATQSVEGGMMWKRIRRRVTIENGLRFDYEISPHRAFLAKMAEGVADVIESAAPSQIAPPNDAPPTQFISAPPPTMAPVPTTDGAGRIGDYVPFKQSRLKGQINPLRPPLHVETVLIGRALGQPTDYLFGVGFRVRDDGYVEAEFADGVRKFDTYERFKTEITHLVVRNKST